MVAAGMWKRTIDDRFKMVTIAATRPDPVLNEGAVQQLGEGPVVVARRATSQPTGSGSAWQKCTAPTPCLERPR